MTGTWLTSSEAATLLGIHRKTIKKIPASELPYMQNGDWGWRKYRRSDVEAYIERRMVR